MAESKLDLTDDLLSSNPSDHSWTSKGRGSDIYLCSGNGLEYSILRLLATTYKICSIWHAVHNASPSYLPVLLDNMLRFLKFHKILDASKDQRRSMDVRLYSFVGTFGSLKRGHPPK